MNKINRHSKILILGSGPAGYTASIYASRSNLEPTLITGLIQGGQLTTTNEIDNWPSEYKGISGSDLMMKFFEHSKKFNTNIINDSIKSVNLSSQPFQLIGEYGTQYTCNALIIATGSSSKKLNIPSEDIFIGKGVSNCATCDGFFYKNKNVVVIGGGNTALEEALYLSNICNSVILIHRSDKFRAEGILQDRLFKKISNKNIIFKSFFILKEIFGDENGVSSINIFNINTNQHEIIKTDAVFIAIGYEPNTDLFKNQIDMKNGYLLTRSYSNEFTTMTSIKGVFAAGDVQDPIYRQAITSAASGCMAAIDASKWLENEGF